MSCWKTICLLCVLSATGGVISQAQTFSTIVNFGGPNGGYPGYVTLVQGTDGYLYGTAHAEYYGTVFKIAPGGPATVIYSFVDVDGSWPHGSSPNSGLTLGTDQYLYGTTATGGNSDSCYGGCGTVFKITETGELTTLHSFGGADGSNPSSVLVEGSDGNFYGTTEYGGANLCIDTGSLGCGMLFRITSAGTFMVLHSFDGSDGFDPFAGVIQGADGSLYGTTEGGGANSGGTVFKITPDGALTTLYSFCAQTNCLDGQAPVAPLVRASDGNFYGTTVEGGVADCDWGAAGGTIFKITPEGTFSTILGSLCQEPTAPLIQAADGKLYGTTVEGGNSNNSICFAAFSSGCGTVFRITTGGVFTTLHSFNWTGGNAPYGGMVQATNGILYGTTYDGGVFQGGTIYSESLGFAPFVTTLPTSRKVGQHVAILGTDLTAARSVTFNGTPATFTVASGTEISTTVPAGATTGAVEVVTPSGVLLSNIPFHVAE
ncbi:MAG: choice-of-anchor tandem repeat GloVer-containing protein [Candidatus Sulfotelmatobacter sp.]